MEKGLNKSFFFNNIPLFLIKLTYLNDNERFFVKSTFNDQNVNNKETIIVINVQSKLNIFILTNYV